MKKITSTRLIKLLSGPSQVTNEEMEKAYGNFLKQVEIISQSEKNYSEVFRLLNNTRVELVFIESLNRYEQEKKCA